MRAIEHNSFKMTTVIELSVAVIVFVFLCWAYVRWCHSYWARRNVPYISPTSIFGNMDEILSKKYGFAEYYKRGYEELKRRGHKHGGIYMFTQPIYLPVDTELIKNIMNSDFAHFPGHGLFLDERKDPLMINLSNTEGDTWRNMRVKLTPTFTSGKMKMMFQALLNCTVPMVDFVDNLCKNGETLDIKEIFGCFTTDVIGSCAFGLECNSFKNPDAEFRTYGRKVFETDFKTNFARILSFTSERLSKVSPLKVLPKETETFFLKTVKDVLAYRKSNSVKRNDFLQLLLDMEEQDNGERSLTQEEIAAQAFVFFIAGFETSSTLMSFCLHELAFNQAIQDKLRDEIREELKNDNGVLTYSAIMQMKYLDKVVNETLRKYPPVPFVTRTCSIDYKVPGTNVIIEKGTSVQISIMGLHRDEEFYPNSEKFDPERFTEENKAKRPAISFLPFGTGPRLCIGMRFALMQVKTGLSVLLNNYRFLPAKDEKYNFEFDSRIGSLSKKGPLKLNATKLVTGN